ncbi:RodZ domain-containing protein [Phenylobacterium sp.]|uniref:RodZ domain-containing protein n=1 Tax=Phenylobacterium sp. TaxID=1871053 RepID=UPI00286A6E10|nr:RodZ domain-containing protein [Phenylobacterium sp.]
MPGLNSGPNIGAALKAVRESRGLSVESLADTTRIRRAYLAAIEEMRLEQLPSRPFTIGYVRAYANALGLDGEAAVERFKLDEPTPDTALREPVGVGHEKDPRLTLILIVGTLMIGAIVLWNVAQRAMGDQAQPAHTAPQTSALSQAAATPSGPVSLGAPLPAPVESTTPTPYETPGLADATAAGGSSDAVEAAKLAAKINPAVPAAQPTETLAPAFVASGAVYGAEPGLSVVTLQARRSASLIVRGGDGAVYFARQLSAGEAYRAPALKGLTVEVSDPTAVQVFVGGQSKGLLPATTASLEKLAL